MAVKEGAVRFCCTHSCQLIELNKATPRARFHEVGIAAPQTTMAPSMGPALGSNLRSCPGPEPVQRGGGCQAQALLPDPSPLGQECRHKHEHTFRAIAPSTQKDAVPLLI